MMKTTIRSQMVVTAKKSTNVNATALMIKKATLLIAQLFKARRRNIRTSSSKCINNVSMANKMVEMRRNRRTRAL